MPPATPHCLQLLLICPRAPAVADPRRTWDPGCEARAPAQLLCGSLAASRSPSPSPLGCLALGSPAARGRAPYLGQEPAPGQCSWTVAPAAGGGREAGGEGLVPTSATEGLGSGWKWVGFPLGPGPAPGRNPVRLAPPLCPWQVLEI